MTVIKFCRCCRELVIVRWVKFLKLNGELHLLSVTDYLNEQNHLSLNPIVAVAKDRLGAKISDPNDVHFAAKALELSKQNTTLLFAASFSDAPPDRRVEEVRREMLSAVSSHRSLLIDWFRG